MQGAMCVITVNQSLYLRGTKSVDESKKPHVYPLVSWQGDPPADVNAKAKELEAAAAAAALASTSCAVGDVDGLAESVADLQMADAERSVLTKICYRIRPPRPISDSRLAIFSCLWWLVL